jgi:hypothetical protein
MPLRQIVVSEVTQMSATTQPSTERPDAESTDSKEERLCSYLREKATNDGGELPLAWCEFDGRVPARAGPVASGGRFRPLRLGHPFPCFARTVGIL